MWIIGCRIVQSILALIINMMTARYLEPEGYGLLNYAASIVTFILPVARLGVNQILVQEIIKYPDQEGETMGTSLLMTSVSAVCCIIGISGFVALTDPDEPTTLIVCVLYSLLLIAHCFDLIQYWYQAKYLSKYTSVTVLIAYTIVAGYRVVLLLTQRSVSWFAVAAAFDYLIVAGVLLVIYRRLGGQRLRFTFAAVKRLFSQSKHYIIPQLMVNVYGQVGTILIKQIYGNETAGYYTAALTIAGLTNFVFVAVIDSMRPLILSNKNDGEEESYKRNLATLYSIIIYMSLLQIAAITFLAKPIVLIINGSQFLPAIVPLRIIVWYTTFSYIGSIRSVWILAEKKQKYLWIINLVGASVNVILNCILIPPLGLVGAAVTALVTQVVTNVVVGFVIPPLRANNRIMLMGLNPRHLSRIVSVLKRH